MQGREHAGTLVIEVETSNEDELDVPALTDRIGALDGQLDIEPSANGRVTIRAEIPCAS